MKKNLKKIFLCLFILTIILGSPILINRINHEKDNNIYKISVSSEDIINLSSNQRKSFYKEIKGLDIDTVLFDNLSILEIENYRKLEVQSVNDFIKENKNKFNDYVPNDAQKQNMIISLDKDDFLSEEIYVIEQYLKKYEVFEDRENVIFYIDKPMKIRSEGSEIFNPILTNKFFIDQKGIKEIYDNDLNSVIGIINIEEEYVQDLVIDQIIDVSEAYNVKEVQLRGDYVFGYPNNIDECYTKMEENDLVISLTEFQTKIGLSTYSEINKGNITRAHEIAVDKLGLTEEELGARISRAIKERNMRFISIRNFIDYKDEESVENSIDSLAISIEKAKNYLSEHYEQGDLKPIPIIKDQFINEIFIAISFSALVGVLSLSVIKQNNKLALVLFIVANIFSILAIASNVGIVIKLYAFTVAITGACASIIIPYKLETKSYILKYVFSAILAIATGVLISCIMYGTNYMLKLQGFSGIKLLYILPPVIITMWAIVDSKIIDIKNLKSLKEVKSKTILQIKRLKIYHYIILFAAIALAYVYIVRSGNSGTAGAIELEIRAFMERVLYIRPRTKEFLIGYPAVFIAYYLNKKGYKYCEFILILGSIGTMSTVNTFTHLHTPFIYSLLRTLYGVGFGVIVGIICIYMLKIIHKYIIKFSTEE